MSIETDHIEADLQASRHRLNDTLAALGDKLSPGQMLDEALGLIQGEAGEFAKKLGRQVKGNPAPTVLIAAGVAMLLFNRRSGHTNGISSDDWSDEHRYRMLEEARWSTSRAADESDTAYEERLHQAHAKALDLSQAAGEAVDAFKARVNNAVNHAREAAEHVRARTHRVFASAHQAIDKGAHDVGAQAAQLGRKAESFFEETPLAAGAIALTIGALIGGGAPLSRPEREGLSGVADRAARAGAGLAERGARLVEQGLERAVH